MSHQQCAISQPASDTDPAVACSAAAAVTGKRGVGASEVFEEIDLKLMRHVLNTVCQKLSIEPDCEGQRIAALAVIRHASAGAVDEATLTANVVAELLKGNGQR